MQVERARKIRRISADTNVLLDVPNYYFLKARDSLNQEERELLKRCASSLEVLVMCLTEGIKIERIGLKVVERELAKHPTMLRLYFIVFKPSPKPTPQIKKLAKMYTQQTHLKPADALLLASASYSGVDILLSWNRDDVVKQPTQKLINEINARQRVSAPILITPSDFLSRIYLSNDKSICFSPSPVPQIYRPQFFLPR
jgi:predicted nucleic acid-binding protein